MRNAYLDNCSTTKMDERVLEAMLPYFKEEFGNPSSAYELGKKTKLAIETAREEIAKTLNCDKEEIYFTSGATESNITAIRGIAYSYRRRGNHIITSSIEAPSVLETCRQLEKEGFEVTYLDPDENGYISIEKIEDSVTDKTILITIMYANNEIGTIQNVEEIAQIAIDNEIYFHTDATYIMGTEKIDIKKQKIDSLSLSAHKFYGPKGIGILYVRKGIKFKKLLTGSHQENNKRPGIENVPAIIGMKEAIKLSFAEFDENLKKVKELKEYCQTQIIEKIQDIKINSQTERSLAGLINISFSNIESEDLINELNRRGICISNGSEYLSGSFEPSHVLFALEIPYELAIGTIRISIGKYNNKEDIDYLLENLVDAVTKLRTTENKETCRFASKCSGNCAGCHK